MSRFAYEMEYVGSYSASLRMPPEVIGALPEGIRINFEVTGGEVSGDRIRGILKPVGGDWFTLRSDGVGVLDVRATIETHDGALIYIHYQGIGDLGVHQFVDARPGGHRAPPAGPCRAVKVALHPFDSKSV